MQLLLVLACIYRSDPFTGTGLLEHVNRHASQGEERGKHFVASTECISCCPSGTFCPAEKRACCSLCFGVLWLGSAFDTLVTHPLTSVI